MQDKVYWRAQALYNAIIWQRISGDAGEDFEWGNPWSSLTTAPVYGPRWQLHPPQKKLLFSPKSN